MCGKEIWHQAGTFNFFKVILVLSYHFKMVQLIVNFSFPGMLPQDDIINLLKMLSSKNPVNEIAAKIALDGGYDPCSKFTGNENFWKNTPHCDLGFVVDHANGYCYKVLPSLENFNDGKITCNYNYDAEMVLFYSDPEVKSFINLALKGISMLV